MDRSNVLLVGKSKYDHLEVRVKYVFLASFLTHSFLNSFSAHLGRGGFGEFKISVDYLERRRNSNISDMLLMHPQNPFNYR